MIIVNADDFGRSRKETDVVLGCYKAGAITSATAMVFMEDSLRAADLGQETGIALGLHLNLSQPFNGAVNSMAARADHDCVVKFITSTKYSRCIYNPTLRRQFRTTFQVQLDEFVRLYGCQPTHIDGHHHAHLCTNMLLDKILPAHNKVRRSFSFRAGEKNPINITYRRLVDFALARRHRVTDYFFPLEQCLQCGGISKVFELSLGATVELMTHPINPTEYSYLMSDDYRASLEGLKQGSYHGL